MLRLTICHFEAGLFKKSGSARPPFGMKLGNWLGVLSPAFSQTSRGQRGKRERLWTKLEKTFIRPIALSTCIRALAIFLVTITLSLDICSSPELGGGISNVAPLTMRSSFIVKPLSAITKSVGSRSSRNPDSRVICWSDALPPHDFERKLIIPLGAIPTRNLTVLCFL